MSKQTESTAVSHTNAVKDIIEVSRQSAKALLHLQSSENINPDGVFVEESTRGSNKHPQIVAHARILAYQYQLAKNTYTAQAADLWENPIKTEAGRPYEVSVPEQTQITLTDDNDRVDLNTISTTTEELKLETLSYRWSFRTVNIQYNTNTPYRETDDIKTDTKRVWLPPRGLQLLLERLEDVRDKLGLAADIDEPTWRSDEPLTP